MDGKHWQRALAIFPAIMTDVGFQFEVVEIFFIIFLFLGTIITVLRHEPASRVHVVAVLRAVYVFKKIIE